jgi:8-amino-7-oxononanoate synthase
MAEEQEQLEEIDFLVGTFGKALASVGAFVLCSSILREYLINHSRSLIFTTALPPVVLNWNHFIFKEMLHYNDRRIGLKEISAKLRQNLIQNNLQTDGSTNIVPVMLGNDNLAVALAEAMQERGYLIFPVRPPAVPEGTARFRLSLTADMAWTDIEGVAEETADLLQRFSI